MIECAANRTHFPERGEVVEFIAKGATRDSHLDLHTSPDPVEVPLRSCRTDMTLLPAWSAVPSEGRTLHCSDKVEDVSPRGHIMLLTDNTFRFPHASKTMSSWCYRCSASGVLGFPWVSQHNEMKSSQLRRI
jgi:hypothetical protein